MKRLFYSTVAVLAFSVSGMANTIELEDLKIKSDVNNDKDKGCLAYAQAAVVAESAYYGYVMSPTEYRQSFAEYYNFCIESKAKKEVL
jgi:hypothetical protein